MAVACGAGSASAQVDLRLSPADTGSPGPYRSAILSVANPSAQSVRAVSIRMVEGGPAFLFPLAVPPEANATLAVELPVFTPEQGYGVRALANEDARAQALATATIATTWPPDRISPVDLIDSDAYVRNEGKAASWPAGFLRELFIAAAVVCIAMASACFLRRPRWRLAVVAAIAVGAAMGTVAWVGRGTEVTHYTVEAPPASEADPSISLGASRPAEALLIVSCLRTTKWRHPSGRLVPIYRDGRQMSQDDAVIDPRHGTSLTLHAGEIRVFRVAGP